MLILEKAKIYGVDGAGSSSPTLARTDGGIGLGYSVGESEIQSDFNRCYPWSNMEEITDEHGNIFIKIPKFYSKVALNPDGTYKHQLSGIRYDGFTTLFIDGKGNEIDYVLVGKYEASGSSAQVYSKTEQTVLVNTTLASFRNASRANGAGYQQYDFLIDMIIKELFLIEFATTNSQAIMRGYTDSTNTAALLTGYTDAVKTPSGSPESNTTGTYSCKYRGIENPFGNTWTFCDGVSFDAEKVYICTDPTAYESGRTTAPYFYMGDRPETEGYAKVVAPFDKNPLLQFTKETGAGSTTYYSDHYYANFEDGKLLQCGGNWNNGTRAGLWYWHGGNGVSAPGSPDGGRLCFKPL